MYPRACRRTVMNRNKLHSSMCSSSPPTQFDSRSCFLFLFHENKKNFFSPIKHDLIQILEISGYSCDRVSNWQQVLSQEQLFLIGY
jgi:hypothetical protein